jgi:DNA replication ATP-dependent helicase Dna2
MNSHVMLLCNELIYENRLTCPAQEVRDARLALPFFPLFRGMSTPGQQQQQQQQFVLKSAPAWLQRALDPAQPVVFLNTDTFAPLSLPTSTSSAAHTFAADAGSAVGGLGQEGSTNQSSDQRLALSNEAEAKLVHALVQGLSDCGCNVLSEKSLAVISPYRDQVALLKNKLAGVCMKQPSAVTSVAGADEPPGQQQQEADVAAWAARTGARPRPKALNAVPESCAVVVSTVDRFQGKDCDIVILSTVRQGRSQGMGEADSLSFLAGAGAGDLLRDWRRINVAITRAKVKLLVLGSSTLMQTVPVLSRLSGFCSEKNWAVEVPSDALLGLGLN